MWKKHRQNGQNLGVASENVCGTRYPAQAWKLLLNTGISMANDFFINILVKRTMDPYGVNSILGVFMFVKHAPHHKGKCIECSFGR